MTSLLNDEYSPRVPEGHDGSYSIIARVHPLPREPAQLAAETDRTQPLALVTMGMRFGICPPLIYATSLAHSSACVY
jgi:hypothetical protein